MSNTAAKKEKISAFEFAIMSIADPENAKNYTPFTAAEKAKEKKTVLFVQKGNISANDKKELRLSGYIVVEAEDLSKIKTVSDISIIGIDDVAITAIQTIQNHTRNSTIHGDFGLNLINRAMAKIKAGEK